MSYWLLKTEPDTYSFDDLVKEKKTAWDGITNALALKHLRAFAAGDTAIIYHTGKERQAVGLAEVKRAAYPDPNEDDERLVVVDVAARERLPRPVTLAEMKENPKLEGFDLLRLSRLSVVPVSAAHWKELLRMAKSGA